MICNTAGSGTLYKLQENQKCEPGLGKKTLVELLAPNANTYIVNAVSITMITRYSKQIKYFWATYVCDRLSTKGETRPASKRWKLL